MTDSTDEVDWYDPADELTLQETELLEKYELYKDFEIEVRGGETMEYFTLREIIQLAKLVNDDVSES